MANDRKQNEAWNSGKEETWDANAKAKPTTANPDQKWQNPANSSNANDENAKNNSANNGKKTNK